VSLQDYLADNQWPVWVCLIISFAILITISCFPSTHKFPFDYILLFGFTAFFSVCIGAITGRFASFHASSCSFRMSLALCCLVHPSERMEMIVCCCLSHEHIHFKPGTYDFKLWRVSGCRCHASGLKLRE
jgi:hypothetical protein